MERSYLLFSNGIEPFSPFGQAREQKKRGRFSEDRLAKCLKALFFKEFLAKTFFKKKIKKELHPHKILIGCPALFLLEKGR